MGFFDYGCIKAALCCFPRVYAWFTSPPEGFREQVSESLGCDAPDQYNSVFAGRTPPLSGYGAIPRDGQSDWIFLTSCPHRSYGIRADGSLWGWGRGPLGDGSNADSSVPVLIDVGPWKHVSTSDSHTLAVKRDNTLWAWGDNTFGQLGNGRSGVYEGPAIDARAKLSTSIASVEVYYGGVYRETPTVSFVVQNRQPNRGLLGDSRGLVVGASNIDPEGASGATAVAVMDWKFVSAAVTNQGSNYKDVPAAVVTYADRVENTLRLRVTASFEVVRVEVVSAGEGYTSPPQLSVNGGGTGSGFSATAVLQDGRITSVVLNSGGSGYKRSRAYVDASESNWWTENITITGGGGSNAILRAYYGNGFVTVVERVQSTSIEKGYRTKPTIAILGGGGSGATVSPIFESAVTAVIVTAEGSGYSQSEHTPYVRSVNVAFDRNPADTQTIPAGAVARLKPAPVSDVVSVKGVSDAWFDVRNGRVAAFEIPRTYSGFFYGSGISAEARIVGGGIGWEDGLPLAVTTTTSFGEYYYALSFSGSPKSFTHRPYIQIKFTQTYPSPPSTLGKIIASPISLCDGTDWENVIVGVRSGAQFIPSVQYWVWDECSFRLCTYAVTTIDSADYPSVLNSFPGQVHGRQLTTIDTNPQTRSQAVNLTGSPSVSIGSGGAKITLLANFDGNCTWSVDDPGSKYNRVEVKTQNEPTSFSWCVSETEAKSGVGEFERSGLIYTPSTTDTTIHLTATGYSENVTFRNIELPESAWSGPFVPEGVAYASFGGTAGVAAGCWQIARSGITKKKEGGLFTSEPPVFVFASSSPIPEQIPGTWKHATAIGNYSYNPGLFSPDELRWAYAGMLSHAVSLSGEVFSWAYYKRYYSPGATTTTPASIGRPAVAKCTWNHDSVVGPANSYTVPSSRFFTLDPPQSPHGVSLSVLSSSRWCDEGNTYPDELNNQFFGVSDGVYSSDEKSGGGPIVYGQSERKPFLNSFTSPPLTVFSGGTGYTKAPNVHFHVYGNPLLSVSTSLKEVPPFLESNYSFARTSSGELWSMYGGWEVIDGKSRMVARREDFSASPLVDSWVAKADTGMVGFRWISQPDGWTSRYASKRQNFNAIDGLVIKPGGISFGGVYSKKTSPVTHSTAESADLARGFAIILDDGGDGYNDYSSWEMKIYAPPSLSLTTSSVTKFSGDPLLTKTVFNEFGYNQHQATAEAMAMVKSQGCYYYGNIVPIYPNKADYTRGPYEPFSPYSIASSVTHSLTQAITRSSPRLAHTVHLRPWRGALIPTFIETPYGQGSHPNYAGNSVVVISGTFDAAVLPTVELTCTNGDSSFTKTASYRIVPITGVLTETSGLTKCSGTWSDFNINSGSRKLVKAAFPNYEGFSAPALEQGFVKTDGSVGLKSDGSLWQLGKPLVRASRVMGNLELKVTNPGKGYTHPVTAEVSPQLAGVAVAEASFNGKVVAIGVDDGGSGYRHPPTITIEGGATAVAVISGPVESAEVTSGGSGYRNPPRVRFSRPGISAFAKAAMSGGVESVSVYSGGSGYTEPPSVVFTGSGTGARATATIRGIVADVIVTSTGSGYTSAPSVSFSGGGGSGATAVAILSRSGSTYAVSSIRVTSRGTGYTSAPLVRITGGGGSGATAIASISAAVVSVSVDSPGVGYDSHPTVELKGACTEPAYASSLASLSVSSLAIQDGGKYRSAPTATFEAVGEIGSVTLANGGSGYSSPPLVKILGGVGSGASASCTISATVTKIQVTDGGSGYTSPPRVELVGGYDVASGSQATATAIVNAATGKVESVTVTQEGSVYRTPPKVKFVYEDRAVLEPVVQDGAIMSVNIVSGGFGYTSAPQVTFTGGAGAAATTLIDENGVITSVIVSAGGSGYTSASTARAVSPPRGKGAAATAFISGAVDSITLTACGIGYDTDAPPTPLFIGGGGDGATATVTISKTGSGGEATSKINGSIIYAQITNQGSGYQSDPLVTVSGGGNDQAVQAVLRAGIEGFVPQITVSNRGKNYLSATSPQRSSTNEACDAHGKRISGGAFLRGPRWGDASAKFGATVPTTSDSQSGGGGQVDSVASPGVAVFTRKPSVHFANTIGVSVETRAKVSSFGIRKGSPLDTTTFNTSQYLEVGQDVQRTFDNAPLGGTSGGGGLSLGLADAGEFAYGRSGYFERLAISDGRRNFDQAKCYGYVHWKEITPTRCRPAWDIYRGRLDYRVPYVRKPRVVIESEIGNGGEASIELDENGMIVDPSGGVLSYDSDASVAIKNQTEPYTSGMIGRLVDPGIPKFIPPVISVTVADGKIASASVTSPGNYAVFSGASVVDLVVHGGGGTGAVLANFTTSGVDIINPGSGYTSTPSVAVVPRIRNYGAWQTTYGREYGLDEKDWRRWEVTAAGTVRAEYVEGSSEDGYISVRGNLPVTNDGVWPFLNDGFVASATLLDGGFPTQDFLGPAFVSHYKNAPTVTLSSGTQTVSASVEASVVRWTNVISGIGNQALAVKDDSP